MLNKISNFLCSIMYLLYVPVIMILLVTIDFVLCGLIAIVFNLGNAWLSDMIRSQEWLLLITFRVGAACVFVSFVSFLLLIVTEAIIEAVKELKR